MLNLFPADRFIRTVHLFYINRLLRMFPILAAVVLLQASLFNHFSDGPFWMNVSQQAQNCRTWWWAALLHVQNYVNATEIVSKKYVFVFFKLELIFCSQALFSHNDLSTIATVLFLFSPIYKNIMYQCT